MRIVYFLLYFLSIATGYAQNQAAAITVHAGEQLLEQLLSDEQKESVTHLVITGTLHEEDYAFMRKTKWKKLQEINLRDAEIDTIPDKAFYQIAGATQSGLKLKIILPISLKYIGDAAFVPNYRNVITLELCGNFPKINNDYMTDFSPISIKVSEDNIFCKEVYEDFGGYSIYSCDGTIFYYMNELRKEELEFLPGTRVIAGGAFENRLIYAGFGFIFPASLDSIGDRAFANIQLALPIGYSNYPENRWDIIRMICECETPPALGKDVFFPEESADFNFISCSCLYVPESSMSAYQNAPGFRNAGEIRSLERLLRIRNVDQPFFVSIVTDQDSYQLTTQKPIADLSILTFDGNIHPLSGYDRNGNVVTLNKDRFLSEIILLRILFTDGSHEVIKLRK